MLTLFRESLYDNNSNTSYPYLATPSRHDGITLQSLQEGFKLNYIVNFHYKFAKTETQFANKTVVAEVVQTGPFKTKVVSHNRSHV